MYSCVGYSKGVGKIKSEICFFRLPLQWKQIDLSYAISLVYKVLLETGSFLLWQKYILYEIFVVRSLTYVATLRMRIRSNYSPNYKFKNDHSPCTTDSVRYLRTVYLC